MTFKIAFSRFMTKVNLNDRNSEKSDIFPWAISKSANIFFYQKY